MEINNLSKLAQSSSKERVVIKYEGTIQTVSVFKDVNGDGKEDLWKITRSGTMYDGSKYVKIFIDRDGDGYNDYQKTSNFDEQGKLVQVTEIEEEDINKVKKRNHFDSEIYNRRMDVHADGMYMM